MKKEERDLRATKLANATNKWAAEATKNLTNRVKVAKAILKGRTGSERLAGSVVTSASEKAESEIEDFLSGI